MQDMEVRKELKFPQFWRSPKKFGSSKSFPDEKAFGKLESLGALLSPSDYDKKFLLAFLIYPRMKILY